MKSRLPVAYVVQIEGGEVVLNLLDLHRGHVAAHDRGVSVVTEVGSLLGIHAGNRLLVMKVLALSFAEPKEAHRAGIGSSAQQGEPLRNLRGVVVGRLQRNDVKLEFIPDSLSTPALGAEAFPLVAEEFRTILGSETLLKAPIRLGQNLRGDGSLIVGLESLVARHVAVLGSSGQGKSCLTAAVLQQIVKFPQARVVIFDINGEYEAALGDPILTGDALKVTDLGAKGERGRKIPYFALGRYGLHRLLIPSERTQRPALSFALENIHRVKWFEALSGAGLATDAKPFLFDDCRVEGAREAYDRLNLLRSNDLNKAPCATSWPHMLSLAALVAESHSLAPSRNGPERNAFNYSNVSPLVTRIRRFVEDPMFGAVVDVNGGAGNGATLDWQLESSRLVEDIFGAKSGPWKVHIVNLRMVSHDLMPFVLGSLLELYAFELFKRGQDDKLATLLVLEEAHHYLRPIGSGDEAAQNSLAYERLAKEGRKFGLALWLSTQRPSEISPTVLTQCNTWISFRLSSEGDLNAVQSACEWVDKREVRRIAGLARQDAIVFGGSVSMPTLIRAATADPRPKSEDGRFDLWSENPAAPEKPQLRSKAAGAGRQSSA